jgi:thioesterase domain-containing protein
MTAHHGKAELLRMRRQGVLPMSLELGLELLDAALLRPEAVLIPHRLDVGVMQRQLGGEEGPALYRVLLRGGLKRASVASGDTSTLRARLAALASDAERLKALVELAQEDIAAVLTLPGASSVRADVPLKELGLDSLMAVELRNRLSARVGTKLPTTLAFDYPTPTAMAQLLLEKLSMDQRVAWRHGAVVRGAAKPKPEWVSSLEALLRSADPEFLRQLDLERRLSGLAEMSALEKEDSCVVPIRPGVGNRVLLYVPGLGHGVVRENTPPVIKQLGGDYPIAGLNPYRLATRGGVLSGSVADLASNYAPHVVSWIGHRSVLFVGGSFGGIVAMAVASELERRGRHVVGVVLLDTQAPGIGPHPSSIDQAVEIGWSHLMSIYGHTEGEKLAELVGAPSTSALRDMIWDNVQCQISYTLPVIAAPVHLLHAKEFGMVPRSPEEHALPDLGWSRFGLELASVVMVEGSHSSIYTRPDTTGHIDALFSSSQTVGRSSIEITDPIQVEMTAAIQIM